MTDAWAKLHRDCQDGRGASCRKRCDCPELNRLSLPGHSADVMAVMKILLDDTVISARLACLWGVPALSPALRSWLLLLTGLHDVGKTSIGFHLAPFAKEEFTTRWEAGHISPFWALLNASNGTPEAKNLRDNLFDNEYFKAFLPFLGTQRDWRPWLAALSHHGYVPQIQSRLDLCLWRKHDKHAYNPKRALHRLGQAMRCWLTDLPDTPPTQWNDRLGHAFAGLLTLADWLGSDTTVFPFPAQDRIPDGRERYSWAIAQAQEMMRERLIVPHRAREATKRLSWTINGLTGFERGSVAQTAMLEMDAAPRHGRICVIEDETGSGKTEAALIHFLRLFEQGAVDGLYFALPTRAAAVQIYGRIQNHLDRLWGEAAPRVVLAIPGYIDTEADQTGLPLEAGRWDEARDLPWAAERPKRYLAALVAVGTIDQALMGALRLRHALLRSASLMRSLLVVDEVHSSDDYMSVVLGNLLDQHLAAGGHALLLSATLGATARCRLLDRAAPPAFATAKAVPYPAIWNGRDLLPGDGRRGEKNAPKQVNIEITTAWRDPSMIVDRAVAAARQGARVLVIRNQVRDVVETQLALQARAPDLCLRVNGVAAPHHSRYAAEDRKALDAALERALGARVPRGNGIVVVASQTAEQSLDIDADVLISDLCPADVLLQRIGRLHRSRARVPIAGFEQPRLLVVAPLEAELVPHAQRKRENPLVLGLVYPNLLGIIATRRALERRVWTIPDDNRELVESATHVDHLDALAHELGEPWYKNWQDHLGDTGARSNLAMHNCLRWNEPMQPDHNDVDEHIATRLGLQDHFVELPAGTRGPFGNVLRGLAIPGRWSRGAAPESVDIQQEAGGFTFAFAGNLLRYDALGLRVAATA
ncbi:MAG: CRISPR-associated helicase Cas3' [Rhodospirillales bacterium]|nr:CRISPR-associated helicase Cas3' [Rhodospirillales bacterium]